MDKNEWRFHFSDQGNGQGYVVNRTGRHTIRMHHLVMAFHGIEIAPHTEPDHINGTRLDNRFENLQLVTRALNLMKNNREYDNKTGYIGVLRRVDGRSSGTRYRA